MKLAFYLEPKYLSDPEVEGKIKDAIKKFDEADKELERVCKELGIKKPEMVCLNDSTI